ncbi:hypothetical protein J699_03777 [Acinetobacter sp. 1000160]|nr:hypothetical protein J522_3903 [Acinetobacter baumannii 146457]EYT14051.1 hypothetical protein J699_03777 [Acinetobacter sp. 1000160]
MQNNLSTAYLNSNYPHIFKFKIPKTSYPQQLNFIILNLKTAQNEKSDPKIAFLSYCG